WEPLTWELSSTAVIAVLAQAVYRFEGRVPLSGAGWPRRLPLHLLAGVAFSLVHVVAMVAIRMLVYSAHGSAYDFGDWRLGIAYELQKDLITYALIAGVCVARRALRVRRERELALVRLERDLGTARLAQLTAQIEPHFVFNTLNAISNRMHEDVEAADRMIAAFAELLRAALSESGSAQVRVSDDVVWLERYFELMRERFRGGLQTHGALDPAARDARIPRLLLQPLVENAFEHGLRAGRGRVDVSIAQRDGRLHLLVEDDGVGLAAPIEDGVGLANVRSRLALLYPGAHALRIGARPGGGTRVEIELPAGGDG
ncbi:MAG TPA: histidine kinase, partial [Dokdonella sp.]